MDHWARGQFPLLGEVLHLRWLALEEALRVASTLFDMSGCIDNAVNVIWTFADKE